jgi:glycosyltransferase involved in cell wall biosynthesis
MSKILMMKISICIPTYEYYGDGVAFLTQLFDSINNQTYRNFNVVISDHSITNVIEVLCNEYRNKFEIIYIKNNDNLGNGSHNTNNAIKNSDGDIIKIMFQDDFFINNDSLDKIVQSFNNNNCGWAVNGSNRTNDGVICSGVMTPRWNENILSGVNTISSPSVLSFKKDSNCFFDENLVMLMDCEMYYQLYLKYGLPIVISDVLICNRIHKNQISSLYRNDVHKEISYVRNKHNK